MRNKFEDVRELEKKKLVRIAWLMAALFFLSLFGILVFSGCEQTSANVYKIKYEQQLQVTDSIKTAFMQKLDLISYTANRKIDSLNSVIDLRNGEITSLNFVIANFKCDTTKIIMDYHEKSSGEMMQYLWLPLNNRIYQIIDSLNRR